MIAKEYLVIGKNDFVRTHSDAGKKISRDGVEYDEALDLEALNRVYIETQTPIGGAK